MPKTHLSPGSDGARVLPVCFALCFLVELHEARDSAYPVLTFNAKNALKVRPQSCSSLKRLTPLCDLVELRETESSAHSSPGTNAETALVPRLQWCSLSPVSLRPVILVELQNSEDSA